MMFRLGAIICFFFGGLRVLGISMELAEKQWKGVAVDTVIVVLLFGIGFCLWKLHRKLAG